MILAFKPFIFIAILWKNKLECLTKRSAQNFILKCADKNDNCVSFENKASYYETNFFSFFVMLRKKISLSFCHLQVFKI